MTFPFAKGHGTRNDFVVLPDLDGSLHGDLHPALVQRLCDRRGGLGADGVLRVLRGDVDGGAHWFMDYRNADGSVSEMCGNGLRVFARYLADDGLVDEAEPLAVDTRDGIKRVTFCADREISVDMGRARVGGTVRIEVEGRQYDATSVDAGNPHAVVFVDSLDEAGSLHVAPGYQESDFPDGVNVEFVERRGAQLLAMRVFERGAGETQSCGTGACASVAAAAWVREAMPADSSPPQSPLAGGGGGSTTYTVDVLGGSLTVARDDVGHLHLKGPAVLVAHGTWTA